MSPVLIKAKIFMQKYYGRQTFNGTHHSKEICCWNGIQFLRKYIRRETLRLIGITFLLLWLLMTHISYTYSQMQALKHMVKMNSRMKFQVRSGLFLTNSGPEWLTNAEYPSLCNITIKKQIDLDNLAKSHYSDYSGT